MEEDNSTKFVDLLSRIPLSGYVLAAFSGALQILFGSVVKSLDTLDPFQLDVHRSLVTMALSVAIMVVNRRSPLPETGKKRFLLMVRALFVMSFSAVMFFAYRHMPIGDASAISSSQGACFRNFTELLNLFPFLIPCK